MCAVDVTFNKTTVGQFLLTLVIPKPPCILCFISNLFQLLPLPDSLYHNEIAQPELNLSWCIKKCYMYSNQCNKIANCLCHWHVVLRRLNCLKKTYCNSLHHWRLYNLGHDHIAMVTGYIEFHQHRQTVLQEHIGLSTRVKDTREKDCKL